MSALFNQTNINATTAFFETIGSGTMPISSFTTLSASSFTVSSINGAVPGSGGAVVSTFTNLNTSTLTVSSINGAVPGSGGASFQIQTIYDAKSSGTNAGVAPLLSNYFPRELNTGNPTLTSGTNSTTIPGMTLTSNVITLANGTYFATGLAPGCRVGRNKTRVYCINDSNVVLLGQNAYANNSDFDQTTSALVSGIFTVIGGPKQYQLEQIVELTMGTADLGLSCDFGDDEIYAQLMIQKIAE